MGDVPAGMIRCPNCGQMLVSAAVRCQFCQADVRHVPRAPGAPQAGANRWAQTDTGPDWLSISGYGLGVYFLASLGFKVLYVLGGDFLVGGAGFLGTLFLAFAFFFRPDWAQQLVRVCLAIAIANDLIRIAFAFVTSPLAKYGGPPPFLTIGLAVFDIVIAGYGMYLTGDERGLF